MAASRKWLFKKNLRARAFGWRGSKLAISRFKEAASEIRSAAKSDPVAAGDGSVWLMERIWPAFQDIDTSSGALGTAVARTLSELIPILAGAPADHATRSKWLERLFEAVQNDGVEYLRPAEERWGEIAHYPDLINKYADRLIEMVRRAWSDHQSFQYVTGTSICLSCLLEAGRYDELQELLATRRTKFWSWHRFGAEALVRQGLWEGAIAFAEGVRDTSNSRFEDNSIDLFCEDLLIQHGHTDEAYRKYGLRATRGTTNLAIYRALVRRSLMVAWMGMGVLPMCSLERLSAARSEGTGAAIPGRERGPRGGSRRRPEGRLSGCYRTEYRHGERAGRGSLNASAMRRVCQTAFNIDPRSACKIGSVAVSMMSAVYGRQMPANGGQIDNLGAFQRQIFGCADLDVLRIRLVVLSEATIIEIESDPKFDPSGHEISMG